jgi:hypothetical protein
MYEWKVTFRSAPEIVVRADRATTAEESGILSFWNKVNDEMYGVLVHAFANWQEVELIGEVK